MNTHRRTSCDCTKWFDINISSPHQTIFRKSNTFSILNEHSYTIPPMQSCKIEFDIAVHTSLPAVCIITAEPYLFKQNIYHDISIIKTNQPSLHITLYNNSSIPFHIKPFGLQFNCTLIVGSIEQLI